MSLIDRRWTHANGFATDEMYVAFQDAVAIFQKHGAVPRETLTKCWRYIPPMERKHVEKELIALFLVALALVGEPRGENRLKNNGYINFLPEKLAFFKQAFLVLNQFRFILFERKDEDISVILFIHKKFVTYIFFRSYKITVPFFAINKFIQPVSTGDVTSNSYHRPFVAVPQR